MLVTAILRRARVGRGGSRTRTAASIVANAALIVVIAGCGGSTKTVTVAAGKSKGGRSTSVSGRVVPVVRCSTQFGISAGSVKLPQRIRLLGVAQRSNDLAAYTNTQLYLIGPAGMDCAGIVGADGGASVVVWPAGGSELQPGSTGEGLTFMLEPACASCRAVDACPFFTLIANSLGFPCTQEIPVGEQIVRQSARVVAFDDPAGVAGDGWPSGGVDPASGVVGVSGAAPDQEVFRTTCTLPVSERAVCDTSNTDVIARYGS